MGLVSFWAKMQSMGMVKIDGNDGNPPYELVTLCNVQRFFIESRHRRANKL